MWRFAAAFVIVSPLLSFAAGNPARGDEPVVEPSHISIESRDGQKLRIVVAPEGPPALVFKPPQGIWDWSAAIKLVIPVDNLGEEPLTSALHVESGPHRSLSGKVAIAPRSAGDLSIWIGAAPPRAMGMMAAPSLTAAGLEPGTLPVTATSGSAEAAHVTSVRLEISRPTAPQRLVIGPLRVEPPSEADRTAYDGIVGGFGQYRPGDWPEKVSSVEMLRAKGAEEVRELAQFAAEAPQRDRFGGIPNLGSRRATGFFRTERRDGRWWLVTPDGNPFFSIGMDVIRPSGATYIDGREFMFRDLPVENGELAGHWSERDDRRGLGAQQGRLFDHGRAFDFYTVNLERKFGSHWHARWREETLARLSAWGFNTIGNWSEPELCAMHRLPYTMPLWPEGEFAKVSSGSDWWRLMPDPFDPHFAAAADRMASHAAAQFRGDSYLIGYFVDNELYWGSGWSPDPRERYSVAIGALAAGPESPAKSALIGQLTASYGEPERLGQAWGIPLSSWDDLRRAGFTPPRASLDNPAVVGDLAGFTRRFAEAYFRTVAEALRRHDPDHLYLGSRFAWHTPEALGACAHWCDVVSFNIYKRSIAGDRDQWARFHALGKPALIGEFHFGSADSGLFWEGLVGVQRESERGPAYARYLRAVADNPDFVGAHWFKYIDEPLTGLTLDGENGHVGFVTVADLPYNDLVAVAREANEAVLRDLQRSAGQ